MDWLVRNLATLGFIGKKLPAPGTFGSFLGTIFFLIILCSTSFSNWEISIMFSFLFVLGIPLTSRAELILKKVDPSEVIWDEFTAIPFVFIFCLEKLRAFPNMESLVLVSLGFVLFRIFDILKPFGIKRIQRLHGGIGIMIDDLVAALFSALILHFIGTFPLSF